MQTTVIKIGGMTCKGCVASVKNVLEKIPGVSQVEVSLDQAQATVQYDPAKANIDQFRENILDAGFEVIH